MAELMAKGIIKVGMKVWRALDQVKKTRKDGKKLQDLIDLVRYVCNDVSPLQEDGRWEKDPKMALAMRSLKDVLLEADSEVSQYMNANFVFQTVKVDAMTKKLGKLREEIRDLMGVSKFLTVHKIDNKLDHFISDFDVHVGAAVKSAVQPFLDPKAVYDQPPRFWTQNDLRARQEEEMAMVSMLLSIPVGIAAVLLRHCHWNPKLVQEEWFSQRGEKLRKAVGLPSSSLGCATAGPKELSHTSKHKCQICVDAFASCRTTMISAGCSHYYCDECWRRYISVAVHQGSRCLSLRCPDPSCKAPVTLDLVHKVTSYADRYAQLALQSYVEDSGGRIKWCPGPDCGRAVEVLGRSDAEDVVVVCDCKHIFCWGCGEEPHRPVPCATACFWLDTISTRDDWTLMFMKRCPKCRRTIINDGSSNHMTCSAPCGHRFCWICLHPLGVGNHTAGCAWYRYYSEMYLQAGLKSKTSVAHLEALVTTKKEEHQKAVASCYYELWVANHKKLQEALEELDLLKRRGGLTNMAKELGLGITEVADLHFLSEAYEEIAECRRVIRWLYPYRYYYHDPKRDADKCEQFDMLHKVANVSLDGLQQFAELNRMKLYEVEIQHMNEAYSAFKANVVHLTKETRHKVEMLMKAAQTDLQD